MAHDAAWCDPTTANSLDDLRRIASGFVSAIGCEYFAYLTTRPPDGVQLESDMLVSDYPDEWIGRYVEKNYRYYDPVVTISRKARLPFFWGEKGFLRPYKKAERRVFYEAGEFDILEGYAIPTAGPEGDAGLFSMTMTARNHIHEAVFAETARLQLFAAQFHDAAIRLITERDRSQAVELSHRERDVLAWTAEGYSSEAVAARMGLTASAVNYHITNCCRKLGAGNKIQAVALAIRRNLI